MTDYFMQDTPLLAGIELTVQHALAEDIGSGDITAELIDSKTQASAKIICREQAIICGQPWVNEVFKQVDPGVQIQWLVEDGEQAQPKQQIFTLEGSARSLLTGERSALNFLQTLSSTATNAHKVAELVKHTQVKILDTRKTLPGLRLAQKYAILQGGCHNHRIGLYDAFLIKENHIAACGGIGQSISNAKALYADRPVEIEVETLEQLQEALAAKADIIMLDNFNLEQIREAVTLTKGRAKLEASGGYNNDSVVAVAETGVDYISIGALTKDCKAVDFSMLFYS